MNVLDRNDRQVKTSYQVPSNLSLSHTESIEDIPQGLCVSVKPSYLGVMVRYRGDRYLEVGPFSKDLIMAGNREV